MFKRAEIWITDNADLLALIGIGIAAVLTVAALVALLMVLPTLSSHQT